MQARLGEQRDRIKNKQKNCMSDVRTKGNGSYIAIPFPCNINTYYYSETSEERTIWDQYKFKQFVLCLEVVLFKRFQSHYIDREDKIWGFSFVHC